MSGQPQVEQWTYKGLRATVIRDARGKITIKIERPAKGSEWEQLFLSTATRTWSDAIRTAQGILDSSVS